MAYVVLARKYRPLRFADLVGQQHVARTLSNAIEQDRVHHAYLFAGARGLGKTTTARILARALVCEQGPTAQPCNECVQCMAVTDGGSVDVMEIDGASNNSVDNIRNLREQVHYLPQTARRKVYVIDEVHMLTTSAFNALLKTLEEPPPHINFVFATTEPQKLPATILSRVSRLDFRRLSTAQLLTHLRSIVEREGLNVDVGGLTLIVRSAEGSVRDAMTLLDQVIAFASDPTHVSEGEVREVLGHADRAAIALLVDAVLERDAKATLGRLDDILAGGQDLVVLGLQLLQHVRDLTVLALSSSDEALDATDSELERLKAQTARVDVTVLGQSFDRLMRVVDQLAGSRTPRLVLEMGLLDLVHGDPMQPLGDLVERLRALSTGTSTATTTPPSTPVAGGTTPRASGRSHDAPIRDAAAGNATRSTPSPAPDPDPAPDPAPAPASNSALSRDLWALARERGVVNAGDGNTHADAPAPSTASASDQPSQPATPPAGTSAPEAPIAWQELEPFSAWAQLLERIRPEDGVLCAMLDEAGLVALQAGTARLAVRPGGFAHVELCKRPQARAALEAALLRHLGQPFTVEVIEAEPSLPDRPSLALVKAQRRADDQAQAESDAREHPAIQQLLDTFDGELRSVRPVQGS